MEAEQKKKEGYQITKENLSLGIAKNRNCDVDDVTIKDFSINAGSNKGENFTCVIYAVDIDATIKGKPETFHYIAKCLPANEFRAEWLNEVLYHRNAERKGHGIITIELLFFR